MMTAIRRDSSINPVQEDQVFVSHEINLRLKPEETYLFDGLLLKEAEDLLNNITFYNEI